MADADMVEVKFTRQKIYHDGTSMVVTKAGDQKEIARSRVAGFLAERAIEEPEGWEEESTSEAIPVADGRTLAPASASPVEPDDSDAPELSTVKVGDEELTVPFGYEVDAGESGWHTITGPDGFEARKVQGAAKLKAALAELPPVEADDSEAPPPA